MRVHLARKEVKGPYAKVSFILLFLLTHLLILASFRSRHLAPIYKTSIYEFGSLEETLRWTRLSYGLRVEQRRLPLSQISLHPLVLRSREQAKGGSHSTRIGTC
jgi:hypothetical protein